MKEHNFEIPGTVVIAHDIHAKSEDGLQRALDFLAADYNIKDCMKDPERPHRGYFATLKESVYQRMTQCAHCKHLNPSAGCKVHGYSCQACGKVLWIEYMQGGTIRFSFDRDEKMRNVTLWIHSYENDTIYCYPKFCKDRSWFNVPKERFAAFMEEFKSEYQVVQKDGKTLWAFYYDGRWERDKRVRINMSETRRHPRKDKCFYREVCVYKGQVYDSFCGLDGGPVPSMVSICDTFKDAPLKHTPHLHANIIHMARQVARCDYYYQDGRAAFDKIQLDWMRRVVEHFTDLPLKEFDKFLKHCRKDGPGFICQLAIWIEKKTGVKQQVENRPNIGNMIVGMSKILAREELTDGDVQAMADGFRDNETCEEFVDIMGNVLKRKRDCYGG